MDALQATYFSRRLAETRRLQSLAASIRFDLSRSGLDDDQLEQAVMSFAGEQEPRTGWGWSSVLDDLMSRDPQRVNVTDMKSLQTNLINLGYASPLTVATGTWDPSWYGAARRFDRDMYDQQMSGKTTFAAPLRAGVELLGQTMPSSIWRNVVGWAKGFAQQTPETVERVGLVGGALGGGAIGGLVGGPPGALVGGVIGGALGFFGDLLSTDAGEAPDASFWASFADALTPFEEYSKDPRAFWEDLGYVGTVASLVGGAKLAVAGAKAVASGAGVASAAGTAADVQLGLPGTLTRWVTGKIAPDSVEMVTNAIARVSPVAHLMKYPAGGVVNSIYTGLSTASVGIHLTAGLGQGARGENERLRMEAAALVKAATDGDRQLTAADMDLIDRANRGVGVGTIEKAIASTGAPLELGSLNMGPQVFGMPLSDWLLPSNLLDVASFVLWPQKLLPIVPGSISRTIGKATDVPLSSIARSWARLSESDHMLRPWVQYFQGDGLSSAEARAFTQEHVTPAMDAAIRLDAGVSVRVAKELRDARITDPTGIYVGSRERRFDIIGRMIEEGTEGRSPTAMAVYGETVARPELLLAHLLDTKPEGLTRRQAFLNYRAALDETSKAEALFRAEGGVSAEFMATQEGLRRVQVARLPEGVMTIPYGKVSMARDLPELERRAARLEAQAAEIRSSAFSSGATPKAITEQVAKATELERQAAEIRALMASKETTWRTPQQYRLVPARLDTPSRGDWYRMKSEYDGLRTKIESLRKQAAKAGDEAQILGEPTWMDAQQRLEELLGGWLAKGYITEGLRNAGLRVRGTRELPRFLQASAKASAIDADVPAALRDRLQKLGYKPVLTGENMILPTEAERWAEATGIGDYTRRRAFFDMIGVREDRVLDRDLWAVRRASEKAEIQQVVDSLGLGRTAEDIQSRIYGRLSDLNHGGAVWGPFIKLPGERVPRLFMIDVRSLRPADIMEALDDILPAGREWEAATGLYGALKRGAAYGGDWQGLSKIQTARNIGRALGLSGFPGFSDVVRTWSLRDPLRWADKGVSASKMAKAAAKGAVAGAVLGAVEGEEPSDIVRGALGGAVVGAGGRLFAGRVYGYLPDALVRLNSALRYTLSVTFDAGRYSEQNMIAMAKYGLPPMFSPKRKLASMGPLRSPFADGTVQGAETWSHAIRFWDELNGTTWFQALDDIDRRMYQAGLVGFSPRNWEATEALLLYQRGWGHDQIREAVMNIGRYGVGRSAAEKSANFVFFPFSFSKKLLSTLGDFAIQAPGRNLLIYEGLRRYYESTLDEHMHEIVENHLPVLEQLAKVNNLAQFGLSPGGFFLKGLGDLRTNWGKAAFVLSQFFVPSGAATKLAQAAGVTGDLAINAFTPIVVAGESIDRIGGAEGFADVIGRYIPLQREIGFYWRAVNEQKTAFLEGETPWGQVQDYLDERRGFLDGLRPMAGLLGFSTPESMLQSNAGAMWKAQWDQLNIELQQRYPSAMSTLGGIEEASASRATTLYELAHKDERSAGEDAILDLWKTVETYDRVKDMGFLSPQLADRAQSIAVRDKALAMVEDRRFRELYNLLFLRDFGPITTAA
jgi:hypothetical protein